MKVGICNKTKIILLFSGMLLSVNTGYSQPQDLSSRDGQRWSKQKALNWYKAQPWIVGVNYIPSNAINYTAMWDKTSFSPKLIDKELELAEKTGFNTVRVVMQYLVWKDDPAYFKETFSRFLAIASSHGIRVVPAFFDDCVFGVNVDPTLGKQLKPLKGWYAWAWSPSPGHSRVINTAYYPDLKKYVQNILRTYKHDDRILLWDLYNEPTNGGLGNTSLLLLTHVFKWARTVGPAQPLSVATFDQNKKLNAIIFANVDVITFHDYGNKAHVKKHIQSLRQYGRPLICTEWLNRPLHSTVKDIVPFLYKEQVGGLSWGLVNGKTQTNLPWGHRPKDGPYHGIWQHDLYRHDFTPYKPRELALFQQYISKSNHASGTRVN